MPRSSPKKLVVAASLVLRLARGATTATNRTIDDYYGDSATRALPVYSDGWNYGPACPGCFVQPDVKMTFDQSWHDTTVSVYTAVENISLSFTGTAVWVYGVVPNYVRAANTLVNVTFELDGAPAGAYTHAPSTSADYMYNVSLYSATALANTPHTLVMTPQGTAQASYLAFDWAQYTYEETDVAGSAQTSGAASSTAPSSVVSASATAASASQFSSTRSHTPAAAIAGGVVGGVGALALLALLLLMCRRHGHRNGSGSPNIDSAANVDPFISPNMLESSHDRAAPPIGAVLAFAGPGKGAPGYAASYEHASEGDSPPASLHAGEVPSPTSPAPAPRTAPRNVKASARREALSRRVRDVETVLADLRQGRSVPSAQAAPGAALYQAADRPPRWSRLFALSPPPGGMEDLGGRIERFQVELDRLRAEQEMSRGREPPPAYDV